MDCYTKINAWKSPDRVTQTPRAVALRDWRALLGGRCTRGPAGNIGGLTCRPAIKLDARQSRNYQGLTRMTTMVVAANFAIGQFRVEICYKVRIGWFGLV